MPFFDPNEQQRLMQQMFRDPSGAPMPPMGQGQGGVGQNGLQLGPSFEGPGDPGQMGHMVGGGAPTELGVQAPDQFNLPVPQIGDQGMVRQPPNIGDDAMMRQPPGGSMPRDLGGAAGAGMGLGAISDEDKQRLIQAIMARTGGIF